MKKSIKLNIEDPCDQDWDKMDRGHGGRHCEKCKTQVIDFTNMSDEHLYLWIKNSNGKVCGRLREDQLNSLFIEPPKPKKHYYLSRLLAAMSLFITQTLYGNPQKTTLQTQNIEAVQNDKDVMQDSTKNTIVNKKEDIIIKGKVLDKTDHNPIEFIEIYYPDMDMHFFTDSNGNFEIILDTLNIINHMSFIIMGDDYLDYRFYVDSYGVPKNLVFNMERNDTIIDSKKTTRLGMVSASAGPLNIHYHNLRIIHPDILIWSGR